MLDNPQSQNIIILWEMVSRSFREKLILENFIQMRVSIAQIRQRLHSIMIFCFRFEHLLGLLTSLPEKFVLAVALRPFAQTAH